jgi:hypothetical protein
MIGVNVNTITHDKKYVPPKGYHKSEFIDNVVTWTFRRWLFKSPLVSNIFGTPHPLYTLDTIEKTLMMLNE